MKNVVGTKIFIFVAALVSAFTSALKSESCSIALPKSPWRVDTVVKRGEGYWPCSVLPLPIEEADPDCEETGYQYTKFSTVSRSKSFYSTTGLESDLEYKWTITGRGEESCDGTLYVTEESGFSWNGSVNYYDAYTSAAFYQPTGFSTQAAYDNDESTYFMKDERVNLGVVSFRDYETYSTNSDGSWWSRQYQFETREYSKPVARRLREPVLEIPGALPEAYQISGTDWQTCDIDAYVKTCPGKYRVTMYYRLYSMEDGQLVGEDNVESIEDFKEDMPPDGYKVSFELPTSVCFKSVLDRIEYEPAEDTGCGGGGDGGGGLGGGKNGLSSISSVTFLGRSAAGNSAGSLYLHAETVSPAVFSPASLVYKLPQDVVIVKVKRDSAGVLRQLLLPDGLADIVAASIDGVPAGFRINFYSRPPLLVVPDPATGLYPVDPGATPLAVVAYENPDASSGAGGSLAEATRLRITRQEVGASPAVEIFERLPSGALAYHEAGGLRRTVLSRSEAGGVTTELTERYFPATATVPDDVEATKTRQFPFGDRVVETSRGSGLATVATTFEYDEDPASSSYGRLLGRMESNGAWERYGYDSSGRRTDTWAPLADAGPSETSPAMLRHTQTAYFDLPNSVYGAGSLVTTTEIEGDVEVSKRHRFVAASPTSITVGALAKSVILEIDSQALVPNSPAAWSDPSNVLTFTYVGAAGPDEGHAVLTLSPDGSAVFQFRKSDLMGAEPVEVVETWRGTPNAGKTDIVAGTRTKVTRSERGWLLSEEVRDVATGHLVASTSYENHDASGRPQLVTHLDGSEETREYSPCCGQLTKVSHRGITTSYGYDALGRREWEKVEAGEGAALQVLSHTTFTYDSQDRVLTRSRVPYTGSTPGTPQLVERNTYDDAGTLQSTATPGSLASDPALTRVTTYGSSYDSATGRTTRTVTLPGGATEITVTDRAGRTLSRAGTAIAPVRYEYGTATLADAADWGLDPATPFRYAREIKLDNAGADTAEIVTTYSDFLGRAIKTVYGDGSVARSFYDSAGRLVRQTDPDGVQTLHAYVSASASTGQVQVTALDVNRNGVIDYNGTDRVTRQTRLIETRAGTIYPVERSTTEVWEADASATPTTVSTIEATPDGLRSWQTAYGLTTANVTSYNAATGERTDTTTLPDNTRQVRISVGGRAVSDARKNTSNVNVTETVYGYDAYGRLSTQTLVGIGTTTTTYYADDQVHTVTTPDPDTTRSGPGYDPQTTTYAYDAAGRVETVTHPAEGPAGGNGIQTFTTYWPTGAVKRTWGSRTYPSEYAYDAQGRVKTLTTWQNFANETGAAVTTWNYSPTRGWLINKRYTDNTGPDYDYWPSGRLKTRDWARSVSGTRLRTTYTYNNAGDLWKIDYADTTPDVTHTYDRLGRLKTTTDAAGVLTRSYQNGRLDDETYAAGAAHLSGLAVTRTQGTYNRPATLGATSLTSVSYGYDNAGRLGTITQGTRVATLGYKPQVGTHESTAITVSGVARYGMTRGTDNLGRISRVDTVTGAALHARRDYTYNGANQRTEVVHEDNLRWLYGYDALGQVQTAQKKNASSVLLPGYDHVYSHDTIGNRVSTTTNGRLALYTPDLRNQYESRTVPAAFDVLGSAPVDVNLLVDGEAPARGADLFHAVIPVDNAAAPVFQSVEILAANPGENGAADQMATETRNAFVAQTPESYGYDLDGNLTQDGRWAYTWDAENRLVQVETRSDVALASGLPRQKLVFAYDAQGRRVRKQVFAWTGGAWATTPSSDLRFVYDAWNLLAEYNALSGNALVRGHVWGLDLSGSEQGAGGVGGLLWTTSGTAAYAPGWDANGNIVAWIDLANGTVTGRRDYGAFGETAVVSGNAASLPFAFSTKYRDSETELYYYGFRYYNPSIGRWLSRDPIEERGGLTLYGMVGNGPLNAIDYLGAVGIGETGSRNVAVPKRSLTSRMVVHYLGRSGTEFTLTKEDVVDLDIQPALDVFWHNGVDQKLYRVAATMRSETIAESDNATRGHYSHSPQGNNSLGAFFIRAKGEIACRAGQSGTEYVFQGEFRVEDRFDFENYWASHRTLVGNLKTTAMEFLVPGVAFDVRSVWIPVEQVLGQRPAW